MSSTSCLLSEEQFLCCICLDVFSQPVTIPCGHNFCKKCITQHWDINSVRCQCPMCKKHFASRPELQVNTFISEMAAEFKQAAGKKSGSSTQADVARPGEIPCDICSGTKLKAVKSCLTCLASYCGVHIDPHQTSARLKTHLLAEPVGNMEARVCSTHKRRLELFCRTDQMSLCSHCIVAEHAAHDVVSLEVACDVRKAELQQTEEQIQQLVQERQLKSQQVQQLKKHSKDDAEREISHGVRIFTAFMQAAERDLNQLIEIIEDRQRRTEEEADGYIAELEEEILSLRRRAEELQLLSASQDFVQLLQTSRDMDPAVGSKIWTEVSIRPPSYEGTVLKAVAELEEILSKEKEGLAGRARLRRVQQYAVEVRLEPETANPWLMLSGDGKQVWCGEVRRDLPDNEERFSLYTNVLAQQTFSSGRFYYEVQVTGKTDWTLGVAKVSVNRKGTIPLSPVNGYWAVGLRNGNQYLALTSPVVSLGLGPKPQTVGVFVSYEEGLVSFYDVDEAILLYSFTDCSFAETLCPVFSPGLHHGGLNATPLILLPSGPTDQTLA